MKTILLFLAGIAALPAQTLAPAYLTKDGGSGRVWIEQSDAKKITYRENPKSVNRIAVSTREATAFLLTPPDYSAALALYENRNYAEAKTAFVAARDKYKFTSQLPGNFSVLSAFYEMECARKLGNYEEIETLFAKFKPDTLLLKTHRTQLEINPIYNAIRSEDWPRLEILCSEWSDKKVTGSIRAQLEYAHGLALKGLGKPEEALNALNKALVADYAASEILVRKAALACFAIYTEHPDVQLARKLHGTPDENPNSTGASLLAEAAALVQMWDTALGRGEALPADYKAFLKFQKA